MISGKIATKSQKSYCSEHGIAYHVFHYYFKRYREVHLVGKESKERKPSFVKLQLDHSDVMAHAELILPDGKRLVFHKPVNSAFLKALIS